MLKWLIFLAVLGVIEIAVIGRLHAALGLYKLVGLYILTTLFGAVLLLMQLKKFRAAMKTINKLEKGFMKNFNDPEFRPSPQQVEKLGPLLFVTLYVSAAILIAIPGIVSDIVGMILALPMVNDYYVRSNLRKAVAKFGG
jgi:UPF0716 family protein affecting phage T7 exclusion